MRTYYVPRLITFVICSLLVLLSANQAPVWGQKSKAAKNLLQLQKHSSKALQYARRTSGLLNPAVPSAAQAQLLRATASARMRRPRLSEEKIKTILTDNPNPNTALEQLWQLQEKHRFGPSFDLLAMQYYIKHFGLVTPHLNKLFKRVSHLNSRKAESRFITRMFFLKENQQTILNKMFDYKIPQVNIRLRYTSDTDQITEHNFNAQKLVLSVEKRMSPVEQKDFSVRHVSARSVLQTPKGEYGVYQYMGPTDLIPNLYKYLLNGKNKHAPVTLVFDEESRSIAMYNEDKTLWLRITPHEYANPKKIHIHLNEYRTVEFIDADGITRNETVNVNLSIPILQGIALPSHPQQAQQFLYEKLVLHPVKNLQGDKHVTIERRPIF